MNHLVINAAHVKQIFFPEQTTMNATYALTKEYKDRFKRAGLRSYNTRTLPRDWFLNEIQKDCGYSDEEIEEIRIKLNFIDNLEGEDVK
ncbi:hypothetical protein [Erysipelothrix anatis]|uniref:hypothetical protein n=1 Tax=Erysipelothrix anatis TaxID=2683713 RepID=UPI001358DC5E|nr:hypothetical protein [Erysipelothrix anatis]